MRIGGLGKQSFPLQLMKSRDPDCCRHAVAAEKARGYFLDKSAAKPVGASRAGKAPREDLVQPVRRRWKSVHRPPLHSWQYFFDLWRQLKLSNRRVEEDGSDLWCHDLSKSCRN